MDLHLAAPSHPNIANIRIVAALSWPQDSPTTVTGPFRISTGFPILPDFRGTARYSVSKGTVARRKMLVKVRLRRVWCVYWASRTISAPLCQGGYRGISPNGGHTYRQNCQSRRQMAR